jgi:MFS family permease
LLLLFSPWSGSLASKIGPQPQLVAGPLLCALGSVLLHFAGDNYFTTVLPGVIVFGIGLTLVVAPLTATVLGAVADRFAGVASGINNAAARAAGMIAVAALPLVVGLSGTEYEQVGPLTSSYREATLWCVGALTAGALIALVARPPRHIKAPK